MQESDSNLKECRQKTLAETRPEGAKPVEMGEGGDAKDGRRLLWSRSPAVRMLVSLSGIFSSTCPRSSPLLLAAIRLRRPGPETRPHLRAQRFIRMRFGWREPRLLTLNLPRWEEEKGGGETRRSLPSRQGLCFSSPGLQG